MVLPKFGPCRAELMEPQEAQMANVASRRAADKGAGSRPFQEPHNARALQKSYAIRNLVETIIPENAHSETEFLHHGTPSLARLFRRFSLSSHLSRPGISMTARPISEGFYQILFVASKVTLRSGSTCRLFVIHLTVCSSGSTAKCGLWHFPKPKDVLFY